ncbi:YdeI/OmpD-associated family protein [Bacillus sp. 1P06AnD]|uniref:YdeI/OmpD-associated family protein n=1 Tax=Bacillus sp. 1P06AnD TaxID=3132208 RepID=UPI0039A32B9B
MGVYMKTIIEKLNIPKYKEKAVLHLPEGMTEFDGIEYDDTLKRDKYDCLFMFIFSEEAYIEAVQTVIGQRLLNEQGYVFIVYPKKNNKIYEAYIDRDRFFDLLPTDEDGYIKGSPLKFSRMVSFNEVFTVIGLKWAVKKTKKEASPRKSQCVDDYISFVEDIKTYLCGNEDLLTCFLQLTPGYQKNWARYVYSAKREATQQKRLAEMERILAEGYKSIDLYRRNKK